MRISLPRLLLVLALPGLLLAAGAFAATSHDPSTATSPGSDAPASVEATDKAATHLDDAVQRPVLRVPTGKPDVRSSAVVIMDEGDEAVLYSRHAEKAVPVASITKLMTALVVLEARQPLDEVLQITAADRDTEKGTTSRLLIGTKLTRGELLHLALMASENRAASALGRNYEGGLDAAIRAMNAKAKQLGMRTARFVEPTGLSSRNVSSAADLTKLVLAASRDPLIQEFSTSPNLYVIVGGQPLEFRNTNTLVTKPDWDIRVQKTGFTNEAGQCLVMKAMLQERPVVIVLLNSVGKYTRVADARRIRRWIEAANASQLARAAH